MKRQFILLMMIAILPMAMVGQGVFHRKLRMTGSGEAFLAVAATGSNDLILSYAAGNNSGVMKTDHLGNVLWAKALNFAPTRIRLLPNDQMLVSSGTKLVKLNATGDVLWTRNFSAFIADMEVAPDGDIFLLSGGVTKCDSLGNVSWTRTTGDMQYVDLATRAAGGCYVVANSKSDPYTYSRGNLLRFNDGGSLRWTRQANVVWLKFNAVTETADGQVFVAGTDLSSSFATTDFKRLDSLGTQLWNTYVFHNGVTGLTATPDSGAAVIVNYSSGPPSFYRDFYMFKVSKTGSTTYSAYNLEFGQFGTQFTGASSIAATPDGALAYAYNQDNVFGGSKAWFGQLRFNFAPPSCKGNGSGTTAVRSNSGVSAFSPSMATPTVTSAISSATSTTSVVMDSLICSSCGSMPVPGFTAANQPTFAIQFTNTSTNAVSYSWQFGDGGTSTAANPSHTYAAAGNYTVTLLANSGCGTAIYTQVVTVTCNTPATAIPSATLLTSTTVCNPGPVTVTPASGHTNFQWSDGSTGSTLTVNAPAQYGLIAQSLSTGCYLQDSAQVTVTGTTVNLGPDQSVCPGTTVSLSAGGGYSGYLWSTGATSASINVSAAGTYSVSVTATNGCTASDVMQLSNFPNPTPTITPSGPTTFCAGGSVVLSAPAGQAAYSWSNGATTQNITVSASGTYTVSVTTTNGCSNSSSGTTVTVNPLPTVSVTATNGGYVCFGNAVTLTATAGYASYLWSTGATTASINVSAAGTYTVTVTSAAGCASTATRTVTSVSSCAVPTGLSVSNITGTTAQLNWVGVPCGLNYQVQYRRSTVMAWTTVSTSTNFFNLSGLLLNTTYQWRMRASCTGTSGWTAYTSIQSFTTAPAKWAGDEDQVATGLSVYPNPNGGSFHLAFGAARDGAVEVEIVDLQGKIQHRMSVEVSAGPQDLTINLPAVSAGIYMLRLRQGDTAEQLRLVIQ